ncbi:hypothetical protein FRUB_09879 [Fimbriiglobus ruber]|uniref:Uncharacterized protein n=2 Tax=Fimbriiglobus ruber TaxID=1908690 RepID=A0A225DG22_9BACT|nr:hypothetical protein FRUB_09879 [Fimbriiglobus ruber]
MLAAVSYDRRRLLIRAFVFGGIGCCFPPVTLYACYLIVQAVRRPEPMAYVDYFELCRTLTIIGIGTAIWIAYLLG